MAKENKIYNNSFESTEIEIRKQDFSLDASYSQDKVHDETIDEKIIYNTIDECLKDTKFNQIFNTRDPESGSFKKLNKADINEVYLFVITKLPKLPRIETFSAISDYFDINPTKFYDSLSNKFKTELIEELRKSGALDGKLGSKLF